MQAGTAQGQPSDHGTQPPNKRPKMALPSTTTSAVPVVDYQVRKCCARSECSVSSGFSLLEQQLSKIHTPIFSAVFQVHVG